MITITDVKLLGGEKAVVTVDDGTAKTPHVTTHQLVVRYHLETGKTLTKDEFRTFITANEFDLLYNKALSYLSYQMRTISEVKKHLRKSTTDERLIAKLIALLKQNNYLSDSRYVEEYVNEKIQFDLVGPIRIKEKLIQKGIHYDLIDAELIRFTGDIEYDKVSELIHKEIRHRLKKPYRKVIDSLKRKCVSKGFHLNVIEAAILSMKDDITAQIDERDLLETAFQKLKRDYDLDDYEQRQKLMHKLMSQGFSYELVSDIVK